MKTCTRCNKTKYDNYFKKGADVCKVCLEPAKNRVARRLVNKAVWNGELNKPAELKCSRCGSGAILYHHEDYDKPLDVTPLCGKCHWERHQEIKQ